MSLNFKMPQNITGTSQDHGVGTETVHKRAGKEKQSRFSLYWGAGQMDVRMLLVNH